MLIGPHTDGIKYAQEHGWELDDSIITQAGPSFHKGMTRMCQYSKGWVCADLIGGHYKNHRCSPTIIEAVDREARAEEIAANVIDEILEEEKTNE